MSFQLVWLKRDIRIRDHRPLVEAAANGSTICLYVYEPCILQSAEYDDRHHRFINEGLEQLAEQLRAVGGALITRVGEVTDVLETLQREAPFSVMRSHEETGNAVTYERDKRVAAWCAANGVEWIEYPHTGVVRRLKSRDGWARKWTARMRTDPVSAPRHVPRGPALDSCGLVDGGQLGVATASLVERQPGGETHAWKTLDAFLTDRGVNYRKDMSSPVEGWDGCSRLSPYLAWGHVSMREVHLATSARQRELKEAKAAGETIDRRWTGSLNSFQKRLRWHCHFMQKLEDEPELEFRNLCRAYDGLREGEWDDARFEAWKNGETGYPLVDACMRAVRATGWLNFRMRAMVVSFSSYHLWLHWRRPAVFLGRQFLDFEPGIHFSQFQMQSGVTGINAVRVYSPTKQLLDQDPDGVFVRRWVPELRDVPKVYLAEPSKMPELTQLESGCRIGIDYPSPVVDHKVRYKQARDRIWAVRSRQETQEMASAVYHKHGSRRRRRERE